MTNRFKQFGWSIVPVNSDCVFPGPGMWLIKAVSDRAVLDARLCNSIRGMELGCDQSVIVASMSEVEIVSCNGAWRYQKISLGEAAKLLAFIEFSGDGNPPSKGSPSCGGNESQIIYCQDDLSTRKFEPWLIEQAIFRNDGTSDLLSFLRLQETYWLVRFLLEQRDDAPSIAVLSERYGVSESHFRRLCRRALGTNLKREMRQWRAADAVLHIVEGEQNMTDVAMRNGFSSSSHFSREIKNLFGISPYQFTAQNLRKLNDRG